MKNNLENAFKNSLQDYEVPYDPKAWEAVSSKLGASTAATGSSLMANVLKWGVASVLLGTVVASSFFFLDNHEKTISTTVNTSPTEEKLTEASPKKNTSTNSEIKSEQKNIESPLVDVQTDSQETNTSKNAKANVVTNNNVTPKNPNLKEVELENNGETFVGQNPNKPSGDQVVLSKYVTGDVSASVVCEGGSITIDNNNKDGNVKFKIDGGWIELEPGKSYVVNPKSSFELEFVDDKGEILKKSFVKLQTLPSSNFTFEANIFENGLPVAVCQAYGDYASYQWFFDDKIVRSGAEVKHNFFDKGDYEVTLKVIDRNGCESIAKKTVRIHDKYNLMAVDAFKPNGSDSRNRTFMPYSLTERDVEFQMTIVDPIDNSIVFSSSDANNAWDGIDQKTGRITPGNKVYLWKVQILNPLPNERPIYAGTIVHN